MQQAKKLPNRWIVFVVATFASICMAVSQFKVTGTMPAIIADWGVNKTTAGLLMSLPAISNIVIALVAGQVINKIGPRNAMLLMLGTNVVFNVVGALAPSFTILAIARFFEGFSFGFAFIIAPVIITDSFNAERRGLPMALWSLWAATGTLLIMNVCNAVTPQFGWQANWWVSAGLLIVALVLAFIFVRVPEKKMRPTVAVKAQKAASSASAVEPVRSVSPVAGGQSSDVARVATQGGTRSKRNSGGWGEILRNPAVVCMALVYGASSFGFTTYFTYYTTYLTGFMGVPAIEANSICTVHTYLQILIALTLGFILAKVPNKKLPTFLLAGIVVSFIGSLMLWSMPTIPLDIVAILLVCGAISFIGPLARTIIPDATRACVVPVGMSLLSLAVGVTQFVSPIICGSIYDSTGSWAMLTIPCALVTLVGIICAVVVIKTMPNRD